jgi:hypothetical protein
MKKLILSLVFVLATGTSFMNANTTDSVIVKPSIEIPIEDGKASDCNWGARQLALAVSEDQTDRGAGGELMTNYKKFYAMCMK